MSCTMKLELSERGGAFMADVFRLADVGEGIHEAEIVRWLVGEGEKVAAFQPVVEMQTDKAIVELSSPQAGVIGALHGEVGNIVRVGDVLVEYAEQAGSVGLDGLDVSPLLEDSSHQGEHRTLAAPATRKLARNSGVDLKSVAGTGPGGRVTKADVLRALTAVPDVQRQTSGTTSNMDPVAPEQEAPTAGKMTVTLNGGVTRIPLRGLRRAIADHMVRSAFTAPHVSAFDDCDMSALTALRRRLQEQLGGREPGARLTFMPFILKAAVAALRAFPKFNAHMDDDRQEMVLYDGIGVGIAVDTPDGLLVPVLQNPEALSLLTLQRALDQLVARARSRKSTSAELCGSTFTITNAGAIGGAYATPILNYPEVAILGIHKIEPRAVVRDGQIVIRDMTTLSMSFDHRVIDGSEGVRFMAEVKGRLEQPELLLL